MSTLLTRRHFLAAVGTGVASLALSACGGAATATTTGGSTTVAASVTASTPSAAAPIATSAAAATTTSAAPTTAASVSSTTTAPATTAAASASTSASASAAAKGKLQFYIYLDSTQLKNADAQLLTPWQTANPSLPAEIVVQPGATVDAITKLTTLIAGGTPPDALWDLGTARNLSQLQLVQPLDDLIAKDKYDLTQFNQSMFEYKGRFQGKVYMIPHAYGGNALGLLYNRQLFQAAGVEEPPASWSATWTWDQWRQALSRLTKKAPDGTLTQAGLGDYGYFVDYPIPYGGKWLSDDFQTITCDSPEVIQSYTDYYDLMLKDHATPKPGEASKMVSKGSLFLAQKAAVSTMGGWEVGTYTGDQAKGLDWAFMPFPKAKVATPDMGPVALALVNNAKNRDGGWEFLKWLVADSRLAIFMTRLPAVNADVQTWANTTFKGVPNARPDVLVGGAAQALPPDNILLHPNWSAMLKNVISPAFDQIAKGQKDPGSAMREMAPQLQGMLK